MLSDYVAWDSIPSALAICNTVLLICLAITLEYYHRQPYLKKVPKSTMVSEKVYNLCRSDQSVSSELAKNPTQSVSHVVKHLYGERAVSVATENPMPKKLEPTAEDLQRAFECGKWGNSRPSELFLRIYHDVLCTLEHDHLVGTVSPPLMGSSGVLPLSIIAPLPDICRHMSNVIARARKEVYLATNYWQASASSRLITNALRELSKRAGERGEKVVVKIIYDRGNIKQVVDNHQKVPPSEYTGKAVQLPHPDEVPNLDLEVVNFHRPVFGTFHSKYMVVDRQIAILSSNNIQDNDNLEMMVHLEGPIVDSFYDAALISWHNAFKPPLPSHNTPAAMGGLPTFDQTSFQELFDQNGQVKRFGFGSNFGDSNLGGVEATTVPGMSEAAMPSRQEDVLNSGNTNLGAIYQEGKSERLAEHTDKEPHYDPDIAAEIRRSQSVLTPQAGESKMACVTRHLNTTIQPDTKGDAPECSPEEEMIPLIPHPVHEPFPMAMVCRKPWGAPNHSSVHTPQNEAWLSALRNAKESVFIQTPDLNAEPLIPAILEAVRRGVEVTYYVCLGYNDAGELLPFQGGHNEMIANKLYTTLTAEEGKRLHIFNYVAKDQTRPIHNKFKKRSCHIKLMVVDRHIGIQGNGNQDTQSWFHSQEINVMIDSRTVCEAWLEGIRRNENTHLYGAVDPTDGVWKDSSGQQAEGAIGVDPGRFAWAKGIVGAVQRVRGAGGF
ncbi:phospholipase D/nuclease [Xylona heveae TC161]|uniref:Phospholipase D/nuclease n=1 Tax=Xylona heveae (strain CBS 132557 / TC161) TaxID=1328760 RepID=A0A164ZUI1_XYLHT|nr:phospholipase D/nuclease [Xylona heveae TC161]KZF19543.1 phospholipase D/nuclease [Xylona heveae TC161]